MKNKILIILLFILFAIPFPATILGFCITFAWFLQSLLGGRSLIHTLVALLGTILSTTYPATYILALVKTWRNNKITAKTFLPIAHCFVAYIYLMLLLGSAH